MVNGLLGRKVGMTQLFDGDGKSIPATVIKAGPCVVVQRRTQERDGYEAAQLGLVDDKPFRRANKPTKGHFAKANVAPTRIVREFKIYDDGPNAGDTVTAHQIFEVGEKVDIVGESKGRGFQGVIKRHGFGGGRATHGSMFHRAPGSIGQSAYPAKVFKGIKLPGQFGAKRLTVKGLEVVLVDAEKNLVAVRGAVPGAPGSLVTIRRRQGAPAPTPREAAPAEEAASE